MSYPIGSYDSTMVSFLTNHVSRGSVSFDHIFIFSCCSFSICSICLSNLGFKKSYHSSMKRITRITNSYHFLSLISPNPYKTKVSKTEGTKRLINMAYPWDQEMTWHFKISWGKMIKKFFKQTEAHPKRHLFLPLTSFPGNFYKKRLQRMNFFMCVRWRTRFKKSKTLTDSARTGFWRLLHLKAVLAIVQWLMLSR